MIMSQHVKDRKLLPWLQSIAKILSLINSSRCSRTIQLRRVKVRAIANKRVSEQQRAEQVKSTFNWYSRRVT